MTERHLAWHYDVLQLPLADILHAAHAAGATLNDAFLSGVTAGLRLLPRAPRRAGRRAAGHHADQHPQGRTTPSAATASRSCVSRCPSAITDPGERMRETHDRCEPMKTDRSLPFTDALAGALNLLPRAYVGGMLKHIDFLASNVPGSPSRSTSPERKVDSFYAFGPTIGAALNVTLMSYCGTCFVGVNIDTGAVPDPDVLMECMRDGFDEILGVVGRPGRSCCRAGPPEPRCSAGGEWAQPRITRSHMYMLSWASRKAMS